MQRTRITKTMKYRFLWVGLVTILLMTSVLSYGCRKNVSNPGSEYLSGQKKYVYYINRDKTRVQGEEYVFKNTDTAGQIDEMLVALTQNPAHNELRTSLNNNCAVLEYSLKDENLTLNMDAAYKDLSVNEEILVRAALVRSFAQIDGVQYVQFMVEGEALTDATGMVVGLLNAESFVGSDKSEISAFERTTITLYFATLDGKNLISGQRQVVYNSNVSMEKMVMEQLIKGPQVAGFYPTINPETKILSVTNKDGTCYVNLSEDFLKQTYDVTTDVVLYSIANSLIDLSNVSRVQIQIAGNSQVVYRESVSLETPLERNLDIVLKEE